MVAFYTPKPEPSHLWGFFHARKTLEKPVSLREELEPVRTGYRSRADIWLATKPQEFIEEFSELVQDVNVGSSQLQRLAVKHGLDIGIGAFTEWRKRQWASKTN